MSVNHKHDTTPVANMQTNRLEEVLYEDVLLVIYHVCFDANFFNVPDLLQHIFKIQIAYVSQDFKPKGEAIRRVIATFGTKAIASGCVRVVNQLDDRTWLGRGNMGCLLLWDGFYNIARLRQDLLDVKIASAVVRRCWMCFRNPDSGAVELAGSLEATVLNIHKSVFCR